MIFLLLLCLILGAILGLLARAAHLRPVTRRPQPWWRLPAIGTISSPIAGLLGIWLFGLPFALPMALWLSIAILFLSS